MDFPVGEGPFPVLLMCSGFLGQKEDERFSSLARYLTSNGIATLRFDASGWGESGGVFAEDYRFSNYLSDTDAVFRYAKGLDTVDHDRIYALGHSMGGMLAVEFAACHPGIKGIVLISAPDRIRVEKMIRVPIGDIDGMDTISPRSTRFGDISLVPEAVKDIMKYDAAKSIKHVHVPSLHIWGLSDITVLPSWSDNLYACANQPKKFRTIEGMGHDDSGEEAVKEQVNNEVGDFLQKLVRN